MTIVQAFVTYATCWWLVLFMVLPYRAHAAEKPGLGHAQGAPANPMIRKKAKWATFLAVVPTIAIYLFASDAKAEEVLYRASGGCARLEPYRTPAGVAAVDGVGASGVAVAPANPHSSTILGDLNQVDIPLNIPSTTYIDRPVAGAQNSAERNVDLSESFINVGKLSIGQDGSSLLNGQPINQESIDTPGCAPASGESGKADSIYSTHE